MPGQFLRQLTGRERTPRANRQLGSLLAFNAGAINAGGLLAIGSYTSHMTGMLSAVADQLVLGQFLLALAGVMALLAFLLGAMTTAWLANWARRRHLYSEYALPLLLEGSLLLVFGLMGQQLAQSVRWLVPATVLCLCFLMGLQNAVVTKLSKAEIRTTHVTGMLTDLGIELGKLLYRNHDARANRHHLVQANRDKLVLLAQLIGLFFAGGLTGAGAFKQFGFSATLPLAASLFLMALLPLMDDVRRLSARTARRAP